MRKLYLLLILTGLISTGSFSQQYEPFPAGEASWNVLVWGQFMPDEYYLDNYAYVQTGDTIIGSQSYHKMVGIRYGDTTYIGAIREDENRRIFFYPKVAVFSFNVSFPTNDQEYMLYDFNDLYVGKVLHINDKSISIQAIDSIEIEGQQRRRYEVDGTGNSFTREYWIEGIGSNKELFSVYTYEFEWQYYTTCFSKDNGPTIFINRPDYFYWDACEYNVGIEDIKTQRINIYPNPATDQLTVTTPNPGEHHIAIYNSHGQLMLRTTNSNQATPVYIGTFPKGIYYVRLQDNKGESTSKFIKR
jgi:hypothetical protein